MKGRNVQKRLFSVFMILVLCVSVMPMGEMEALAYDGEVASYSTGRTIYTEFTGTNDKHSGDGSQGSPYNLFEDAYDAAQDGDIIYILGAGAFLNSADNEPFVINKNITIKGNNTTFSCRKAGIILAADVTFDNVVLSFAHRYHDAIFANGHKLILNNVSCESGARCVDIFGGPLYDLSGNIVGANPGSKAEIIIDGGGENLGNVYGGAMNGDYAGSTSITMTDVKDTQNDIVYADGATETYIDMDHFFDIEEPEPPMANGNYTIEGGVTIELKNCSIKTVSKEEESNGTDTSVIIDTDEKYIGLPVAIDNVNELIVKGGGTYAPTALSECSVILQEASTIDLSEIGNPEIENPKLMSIDSSDGTENKLVLKKDQTLYVSDTITGRLLFKTNAQSGIAEYEHVYFKLGNPTVTGESGEVILFAPSEVQADMTLNKIPAEGDEVGVVEIWKTSEAGEYTPVAINDLRVTNSVLSMSVSEISDETLGPAERKAFEVKVEWLEGTDAWDCFLEYVPIEYEIVYEEGQEKDTAYSELFEELGNYEANVPELKLSLWQSSDEDDETFARGWITPVAYMLNEEGVQEPPKAGIYHITMRPLSAGEPIERKVTLILTEDAEEGNLTAVDTATTIVTPSNAITMQDSIQITGTVEYEIASGNTNKIPNGEIKVFVNQNEYGADLGDTAFSTENGEFAIDIDVTEENGFQLGENTVTVIYMGAEDETYLAYSSQNSVSIMVNPLEVELDFEEINQQIEYTGKRLQCQLPTINVVKANSQDVVDAGVMPEVIYKQGGEEVNPILLGVYEVYFYVTGEKYNPIEVKAGTFTITAATPTIHLTTKCVTTGAIQISINVKGSNTGSTPVGSVKIYQDGALCKEEVLRFGETEITVSGLEVGKTYTFKVEYVLNYAGNPHYTSAISDEVSVTMSETEDGGTSGDNTGGGNEGGNDSTGGGSDDNDNGTSGDNTGSGDGGSVGDDTAGGEETPEGGGSSSGGDTSGGGSSSGNGGTTGGGNGSGNGGTTGGGSDSGNGGTTGGGNGSGNGGTTGSGNSSGNGSTSGGGNGGTSSGGSSSGGGHWNGGISIGGNTPSNDDTSKEESTNGNKNEAATSTIPVATASGSQKKNSSSVKTKVTKQLMEQIVANNNGKDTDVSIKVQNAKGELSYILTVNTADMKKGNKLYICEKDSKTGELILVNSKTYKVSKYGNVNVTMAPGKEYVLLNEASMNKVTDAIVKNVTLKKKTIKITSGKRSKITLSQKLNTDNVKSITYINENKGIVAVSKKGSIRGKQPGTAIIRVKVKLKNGDVKMLKAKVVIK